MRPTERWTLSGRDDAWLSRHLGRPALLLDLVREGDDRPLRRRLAAEAIFATAKVPAQDVAALRCLEDAGCRVVDLNLTFSVAVGDVPCAKAAPAVRPARPEDSASIEDIAGTAFRFTRFHLDDVLPARLADRIKRAWAGNYFAGGRGTALLVAEDGAGVCGFLLVLERGDAAVIDLIAVAARAAGRGYGSALVAALGNAPLTTGQRPRRLIVGSQAANAPAIRFYEGLGFRVDAAAYVLHHHGNSRDYRAE